MQIDLDELGAFSRLAREGAQQATASLGTMTGIDATVEVTRIALADPEAAGRELGEKPYASVAFELDGALDGEAIVAVERESAPAVAGAMGPAGMEPELTTGVTELSNVMVSGFVDGWAEYLDTPIEHDPPTFRECAGSALVSGDREQLFVFQSEIEWRGERSRFQILLLPEYGSLTELLAGDDGADPVPAEKLDAFSEMTRTGAERAAANVTAMSGIETTAEVARLSFVPIEDAPNQVAAGTYAGTVSRFSGTPSGHAVVLFEESAARQIAEALLPGDGESGGELTGRHEAALTELGNVVTSGLIDGWANVLEGTIEHEPPRYVHDMGRAVVDQIAAQLGREQRHAVVVEAQMHTDELEFGAEVHVFPDNDGLKDALLALSPDRLDQTGADPSELFET